MQTLYNSFVLSTLIYKKKILYVYGVNFSYAEFYMILPLSNTTW